jgi:CRP-like cAMP-binding protein
MYFLMDGTASVYKCTTDGEPYKVAIIQGTQRAFFGEGGLLDLEARSATIRTETECRCLVLNGAEFAEFGRNYPQWALPVLNRIARAVMVRLRKTNNDLMLLYNALVAEIRGQ